MPEGIGYGGMSGRPNVEAGTRRPQKNVQTQRAEARQPSDN